MLSAGPTVANKMFLFLLSQKPVVIKFTIAVTYDDVRGQKFTALLLKIVLTFRTEMIVTGYFQLPANCDEYS